MTARERAALVAEIMERVTEDAIRYAESRTRQTGRPLTVYRRGATFYVRGTEEAAPTGAEAIHFTRPRVQA